VEGEILYEAQRIRASLPLYTDPVVGALDEGAVPARFFVLYPPILPWLLSLVPERGAAIAGRALGTAAWFGTLAAIVGTVPGARRKAAFAAAAFAGGIYTLTLFASTARPDSLAVALAGAGLLRAVDRRRLDAPCGVLFALAAWTKPNVLGLAAGAMVAGAWVNRRGAALAAAGALGAGGLVAGVLEWVSRARGSITSCAPPPSR